MLEFARKPDADNFSSKSILLVPAIVFSSSGWYTGGKSGGPVSQSVMKNEPSKLALSSEKSFQFSRMDTHRLGFHTKLYAAKRNCSNVGYVQAILNVGLNIPGTAFIAMPASPLIVWGFTAELMENFTPERARVSCHT